MLTPASMATTSLNKNSSTSTDSKSSDDKLRNMEAPLHVDTPLWNISSVSERRTLLNRDTAKAEHSILTRPPVTPHQVARIDEPASRWPDGVVPYVLDPDMSAAERQDVLDGIEMIESQTNIVFVQLPDTNRDGVPDGEAPENYIKFVETEDSVSWSQVGMIGGEQEIITSSNEGSRAGVVAHEIMHALGFYHEHNYPDIPDNFTEVVSNGHISFDERSSEEVVSPYDMDSIMHYPAGETRVDGELWGTITPADGVNASNLGQRNNLSSGDIAAVYKLYPGGAAGYFIRELRRGIQENTGIINTQEIKLNREIRDTIVQIAAIMQVREIQGVPAEERDQVRSEVGEFEEASQEIKKIMLGMREIRENGDIGEMREAIQEIRELLQVMREVRESSIFQYWNESERRTGQNWVSCRSSMVLNSS